jgi:hypothetical protein
MMALLVKRYQASAHLGLMREAVAVLEAKTSTLDERDWAERHLNGMVHLDVTTFMEHRLWQS